MGRPKGHKLSEETKLKMSERKKELVRNGWKPWDFGIKRGSPSQEWRDKISKANTKNGIRNYRMNALTTNKCMFCKSKKNIIVHHEDLNRNNNKKTNLIVLCRSCHKKLHDVIRLLSK